MDFSRRLREERLKLGLSLRDVEEETKIRKYYLEALEEGNFGVLPPPPYASGFVKRYAKILGLNEGEIVDQFRELAYGKEEKPEEIEPEEIIETSRKPLPIKNIIAGVVFLVLAIWLGNYVASYIADSGKSKTGPQPGQVQQTQPSPPQGQQQAPPQTNPPPAQPQGVKVDIEVVARCWLSITIDGKPNFTGTLVPGDKRTFAGNKSVVVNAGNAGGIKLTVNNQPQPALGATGQHVVKEFNAGQ